MHKPFRQTFAAYNQVADIACGYGFTLFKVRDSEKRLWGTGVNQSGQLGHHRGHSGKPLEVVVAPAAVNLPLANGELIEVRSTVVVLHGGRQE